jgi:hypothetical protein
VVRAAEAAAVIVRKPNCWPGAISFFKAVKAGYIPGILPAGNHSLMAFECILQA